MNILVCEDEEILLTALEFRIRKHGFKVVLAKDGDEVRKSLKKDTIHCVILDIDLPQMKNLELLRDIRNDFKLDIPIIIISELNDEDRILEAISIGANDFVTKPFKPNELVLRTRRIFMDRNMM